MAKTAKGKRPVYFEDPQVDKLLAMVIALAGEVSVLRERLDTLERLLETKDIVSISTIEAYQPDEQVEKERSQWRQEYIARVMRVLQDELDAIAQN